MLAIRASLKITHYLDVTPNLYNGTVSPFRKRNQYPWYTNVGGGPRGVMVKVMDYGLVVSWVQTPVSLLFSLSDKYPWERYEPPYPPSYGLNTIAAVFLEGSLWH